MHSYQGSEQTVCQFDLTFTFSEVGDELELTIQYNTDLYEESTVRRLAGHLEQMLSSLLQDISVPINKVDYLSWEEKRQLLEDFNDTAVAYPHHQSIADVFEQQVAQTPEAVAVVFEDQTLTYGELNEQANRLAHWLVEEHGVQPQEPVGVLVERSELLIIALVGILKAGGAYLPLEGEWPAERRKQLLQEAGSRVLLTQTEYLFHVAGYQGALFALDVQLEGLPAPTAAWRRPVAGPRDLAYVLFTSGSSGRAKGVLVEHRSVVRLVKGCNYITLRGSDVLLSTGAVSFDATTFEYWGMLLNGGRLVLCRREQLLDSAQLAATLRTHGVTLMWCTAGWLHTLVEKSPGVFEGLRTLVGGGDRLSALHVGELRQRYPSLELINGYGPTENTTFSLCYNIGEVRDPIAVGRPISNSTAYILDDHRQLCPIGVVGEICVGGAGLGRGYLGDAALTEQKFVPHPFEEGQRIYRTGDRGRWLSDGNIEFVGRIDDQVKIRGYRIEPAEVESALQGHGDITSAVVVAKSNKDKEKELVAYLTANRELTLSELQAFLQQVLPSYMIPSYFVQLASLPLTVNGKVDRKSLPDPVDGSLDTGVEYVAARNEVEAGLVDIWQEILCREGIGIRDNFFELGGHSLKATRLASLIHKNFDVQIGLKELFTLAVLEEQAVFIMQAQKAAFQNIEPVEEQADYVLSSSQRGCGF